MKLLEGYDEDQLREWSRKGGKAKVPKGFSMITPEERREYGRKGGKKSKRPKGHKAQTKE